MKQVFKEPLVSIVIPVYNVEPYLVRCLDSVISQTYKNLQIIVVDDGSTDNSGKICDKYAKKDKRIKVIHKKNGGLSDARNKGIEAVKGDYISFIDSDDWVSRDFISMLLGLCVDNDAQIACCSYTRPTVYNGRVSDGRKGKNKVYSQKEYFKKFFKIGTQETCYYAWNKLYHKSVINREQYPLRLTAEDVVGTFRAIMRASRIAETSKKLYFYYKNPDSITERKISSTIWDLEKVWDIVVTESKNTDYYDWASINRDRIDYTILMRLMTKTTKREYEEKYKTKANLALRRLRNNYRKLLNAPISLSRKITIFAVARDYDFVSKITRAIRSVKK